MANLFDFASKNKKIEENNAEMNGEGFWNDQRHAQSVIRETNAMKSLIENFSKLKEAFEEVDSSLDELKASFDPELKGLVEEEYIEVQKQFDSYEIQVLLSGPYDNHAAILEIHPGAGGTEAMARSFPSGAISLPQRPQ